jgi:hypothetical protein
MPRTTDFSYRRGMIFVRDCQIGTMEAGDLYWTMIEPHWKRVTIYEGGDPFLREYARTPETARNLLSAHWCQSEVCNGGLHQFFFNPTGVLAPEGCGRV